MDTSTKISLAEAARRTPGRPHASTLFRWATKGHRGVKLEVWSYGRRLYTTIDAVDRFAKAVALGDPLHSTRDVVRAARRGGKATPRKLSDAEDVLRRAKIKGA